MREERDIADRGGVLIELLTEVLVEDELDVLEDGARERRIVIGFELILRYLRNSKTKVVSRMIRRHLRAYGGGGTGQTISPRLQVKRLACLSSP
jgi:hypothetical protein